MHSGTYQSYNIRKGNNMFTKEHYKSIAKLLKIELNNSYLSGGTETVQGIINEFSFVFSKDNSRFDKELFLSACGMNK